MVFINPFKKRDPAAHTAEVLIPLADGNPPGENGEMGKREIDSSSNEEKGIVPDAGQYTTLTLEALRAEVESNVATCGHDSSYDRMLKLSRHFTSLFNVICFSIFCLSML